MKEIECPECGEMIYADSMFCDMCGTELLECVSCGAVGTGVCCAECGKPMVSRRKPQKTVTETDVAGGDGHNTAGRRKKTPVLKARGAGGLIIKPEHEAEIGRRDGPYAAALEPMELISRRHGKFVKQGRDWYIVDLGSTNGTLVNDVELSKDVPVRFRCGDVIDIGTYIFDVIEE